MLTATAMEYKMDMPLGMETLHTCWDYSIFIDEIIKQEKAEKKAAAAKRQQEQQQQQRRQREREQQQQTIKLNRMNPQVSSRRQERFDKPNRKSAAVNKAAPTRARETKIPSIHQRLTTAVNTKPASTARSDKFNRNRGIATEKQQPVSSIFQRLGRNGHAPVAISQPAKQQQQAKPIFRREEERKIEQQGRRAKNQNLQQQQNIVISIVNDGTANNAAKSPIYNDGNRSAVLARTGTQPSLLISVSNEPAQTTAARMSGAHPAEGLRNSAAPAIPFSHSRSSSSMEFAATRSSVEHVPRFMSESVYRGMYIDRMAALHSMAASGPLLSTTIPTAAVTVADTLSASNKLVQPMEVADEPPKRIILRQ